jgi:arylsulfate sulfotransferase
LTGQLVTLALVCCGLGRLQAHALMITSPPSFTVASNAPLAGLLQVSTDVPSRVSVSVSDGTAAWSRDFYDYGTVHSQTLLGFKVNRTNEITVTVHDRYRNTATAAQPVVFITAPLPSDFPPLTLLLSQPKKMEPGYTLFRPVNMNSGYAYLTLVDSSGEVVWYSGVASVLDVRQLANGDLLVPLQTSFVELNMLAQTVRTWTVPAGYNIDMHDGVPTDHGTILYLSDASRVVTNFPTSSTDPNASLVTTNVDYQRVVEISATNSALLNTWNLIDLLQPTRIDYLTFNSYTYVPALGWDCEHANAVIEDPRDDSLIVSMRHQDAVVKFSRATRQLKWILGPHANWSSRFQPYLLTPVGTPFEWNYAQHRPQITPQGTLLLYDNGDFRASPFAPPLPDASNYSRAVEYSINEQTMEVTQVWDYGRTNAQRLYTDKVGNADWLPLTGNVLIGFGSVEYVNGMPPSAYAPNATMVRIQEVTHEASPQVIFDLAAFDYGNTNASYLGATIYRAHRVPDLYAHLPQPVQDLTVQLSARIATLVFSADPARSYTVQVSPDLQQWHDLGTPASSGSGEFTLADSQASVLPVRYYRVVSH